MPNFSSIDGLNQASAPKALTIISQLASANNRQTIKSVITPWLSARNPPAYSIVSALTKSQIAKV